MLLQGLSHCYAAMPVSVSLDHGQDLRMGADRSTDRPVIADNGLEIDPSISTIRDGQT